MADKRVAEVLKVARVELARTKSRAELEQVRVNYLGRQGVLTRLLTHSPMFHQVEGLAVGRSISMAAARGVGSASSRGGWRSWAPGWCTPRFLGQFS